jgi:hypothetical protein
LSRRASLCLTVQKEIQTTFTTLSRIRNKRSAKKLDARFHCRERDDAMSSIHQLASAFLVGMFGAVLLITAHLFAEYRAVKFSPFQLVHAVRSI